MWLQKKGGDIAMDCRGYIKISVWRPVGAVNTLQKDGGDRLPFGTTYNRWGDRLPCMQIVLCSIFTLHSASVHVECPHFAKAADQSCRLEEGCSSARRAPSSSSTTAHPFRSSPPGMRNSLGVHIFFESQLNQAIPMTL